MRRNQGSTDRSRRTCCNNLCYILKVNKSRNLALEIFIPPPSRRKRRNTCYHILWLMDQRNESLQSGNLFFFFTLNLLFTLKRAVDNEHDIDSVMLCTSWLSSSKTKSVSLLCNRDYNVLKKENIRPASTHPHSNLFLREELFSYSNMSR